MPALDGLRVLDLTQFEAGPACTQALAWLGADVVKVEKPGRGDRARGADSARNEAYAPLFCAWNANKRSLAIDIGSDLGHALFLRLVPKFDVLVENFGPGVMERLGIDPEALRPVAPGLIYARIKGFGNSGPYAGFAVQQPIAQAAAGALSINGEPDGPPMVPGSMGDAGAGIHAAVAVLAAWAQKLRTGRGQQIDLSMQEAMTFFMRGRGAIGSRWGARAAPRSGSTGDVPPGGLYPCKPFGPNDYVYLMPMTESHWTSLCTAMCRPELRVDLRFYSMPWRIQNHRALHAEISSWTRARTKFEAMEALGAAGVPCSALPGHGRAALRQAPGRARLHRGNGAAGARQGARSGLCAAPVQIAGAGEAPASPGGAHRRVASGRARVGRCATRCAARRRGDRRPATIRLTRRVPGGARCRHWME